MAPLLTAIRARFAWPTAVSFDLILPLDLLSRLSHLSSLGDPIIGWRHLAHTFRLRVGREFEDDLHPVGRL